MEKTSRRFTFGKDPEKVFYTEETFSSIGRRPSKGLLFRRHIKCIFCTEKISGTSIHRQPQKVFHKMKTFRRTHIQRVSKEGLPYKVGLQKLGYISGPLESRLLQNSSRRCPLMSCHSRENILKCALHRNHKNMIVICQIS